MKPNVIILGGGLIGSSIALHLSKRGCKCTVIEKDNPGRHASGGNAGGLRQLNRNVAEIPLSMQAAKMWQNITSLVDSDCDARFTGQIRVAEHAADMNLLEERAELTRKLGYTHEELIGKEELYKVVPALAPHCVGALICRNDGHARPFHALTAFRTKAESLGSIYHSSTKVTGIIKQQNTWKVDTDKGEFSGDVLVNCTGAWANHIASLLDEPVPVTPKALMLMVTERLPKFVDPVMGAASRKLSFKQMDNGTLIIGGALVAKLDFKSETTQIDWHQLAKSAETVTHFFPQLKDVRIVRAWAGIESFMPDNIPVISQSQTHNNAYHAFGFSAHGFQLSPVIGKVMSELILDGKPSISLDAFRINRFNS